MAGIIELKNVSKSPWLNEISFSFEIGKANVVSVYGNDRVQLTNLLKIISGLSVFDSGELLYNGTKSLPIFPYIPMSPSSFPWLTVKGNVEAVPDRKKDVQLVINAVGLQGYEHHIPDSKSIGFRFRISLARALSLDPALILIDNTFTGAEEETKMELFALIKKISAELNIAFLISTDDIIDAVSSADEVITLNMNGGKSTSKFPVTGNKKEDLLTIIKDVNAG